MLLKLKYILSLYLVFCSILGLTQTYSNLKIDGNYENKNLFHVLQSIENQYEIRFFYSREAELNRSVKTLNWNQKPIELALFELFENTNLTYEIIENVGVAIAPKEILNTSL